MFHIDYGVIVVELFRTGIKANVVDKIQRVHRLQQRVVLILVQLLHHSLRGV